MASRIIFLGTAGDGLVGSKQHRASGGIIIDVDENLFHINPGPGSLVRAQQFNINLRQNIAVLVSSDSLLDSNDVNAVIEAMTYAGMDKKGVLIAHQQVIDRILNDAQRDQISKIITAQPDKKLGIENVDIQVLRTSTESNLGFKFYTPDFVVSYSGRTGNSPEVVEQYKESDILILNVTNPTNVNSKDELSTTDAVAIVNQIKPKIVILTHFGIKMLKADPMYEAREVQRLTQTQTIAAKDGFILSPIYEGGKPKQKTLLDVEPVMDGKVPLKDIDGELY
jgi:hypothetical protein